jgi:hypothetical protein
MPRMEPNQSVNTMAAKSDPSISTLLRACRRWQAIADAQAELKGVVLDELKKFDPANPLLNKHHRNRLMLAAYHRALTDAEDEYHIL